MYERSLQRIVQCPLRFREDLSRASPGAAPVESRIPFAVPDSSCLLFPERMAAGSSSTAPPGRCGLWCIGWRRKGAGTTPTSGRDVEALAAAPARRRRVGDMGLLYLSDHELAGSSASLADSQLAGLLGGGMGFGEPPEMEQRAAPLEMGAAVVRVAAEKRVPHLDDLGELSLARERVVEPLGRLEVVGRLARGGLQGREILAARLDDARPPAAALGIAPCEHRGQVEAPERVVASALGVVAPSLPRESTSYPARDPARAGVGRVRLEALQQVASRRF